MTGRSAEKTGHSADEILLAFAAAVRATGVKVTADRSLSFVDAVGRLSLDRRSDVFWAGRATLCASPEDLPAYQRTFEAWFAPEHPTGYRLQVTASPVSAAALDNDDGGADGGREHLRALASSRELLRHRDVAVLDDAERAQLYRMFEDLPVRLPTRKTRRKHLDRHGDIDRIRTLRDQLRRGGEPGPLRRARAPRKPRRMVLLIDVSGSMAPYADSLLRLAHRVVEAAPRHVEVFTLGTRLTRVTGALRVPDPENALALAGRVVPDWSGGTRLGEVLRAFNDRWGQRAVVRGAVVVIMSDGWERGDPTLLGRQAERLHHLARRVIWSNPHRGKAGYQPLQRGIKAVLPHVDYFVGGHSMQSFEELLDVVANA
ncbi:MULTISPECIES: VWA domain-containing protein [Arthrobacter]|uniref:VWA domain-containing protein n=1 Tax=Arthrobacter terricola TaxID=2547396 RepID=A0A4R5KKB0_9MICC|nr:MULTISPECIES: VWA domain-containing protein [Arthrobacter]MBT8159228.1 VWA domain-containing protein [Arthrobacter sp. GN70]TDF94937.1 VWA domain-containing protein [Arthrobacter terricola]